MALALFFGLGDSGTAAAQVHAQLPVVQATLPVEQAVARIPLAQPSLTTLLPQAQPQAAPVAQPPMPLAQLVDAEAAAPPLDEQSQCLATAVYFESMGEPLEGQLAVAQVVINRSRSGRYPASWCGVVKQKAQFSFVRGGRFPHINPGCEAWRKAQAIAKIAANNLAQALPSDVLWYHANYVAPTWRRNLTKVEQIGAHIFYRA